MHVIRYCFISLILALLSKVDIVEWESHEQLREHRHEYQDYHCQSVRFPLNLFCLRGTLVLSLLLAIGETEYETAGCDRIVDEDDSFQSAHYASCDQIGVEIHFIIYSHL